MLRAILPVLALCAGSGLARAQSAPEKPVYTYVAEYGVPRANWDEFTERWQKQSLPVLQRLLDDGTLVEFGATANAVHTPGGNTHSFWWTSPTFAGTQRVMAELGKTGGPAPIQGMTHRDRLLRSVIYRARSGKLSSGFSAINVFHIRQGKNEEWRKLYDKYTKPVMDELFEQGTILGYGIDAEQVHTEKMGARFGWVLYPDAEAIDKLNAAFDAARQKVSADERRSVSAAFRESTDGDGHRDGLDRILFWAHK